MISTVLVTEDETGNAEAKKQESREKTLFMQRYADVQPAVLPATFRRLTTDGGVRWESCDVVAGDLSSVEQRRWEPCDFSAGDFKPADQQWW